MATVFVLWHTGTMAFININTKQTYSEVGT